MIGGVGGDGVGGVEGTWEGSKGPVPVKRRRTTRAGMEPSRRGSAHACCVVVSTPPTSPPPRRRRLPLDDAFRNPLSEFGRRMAEEVDEDFVVVLARIRGEPLDAAWGLRELQRGAGRFHAAVCGMVELDEHLAGLYLRIGDHLGDVVHR